MTYTETVGVRVKPLEWKPFTSDEDVSFMFAAAFGVRYEVFHKASDVAKIGIQVARMQHVDSLLSDDDGSEETTTIIGYGKDLVAAYAIAQSDFNTLVLSALKEGEAACDLCAGKTPVGDAVVCDGCGRAYLAPVPVPVKPERADYLVWSNEHRAWWRANSQGYARSILEAGRYTRAEAVDIADKSRNGWKLDGRPDEIAVAIADLPAPIRAALQLTTRAGSHA